MDFKIDFNTDFKMENLPAQGYTVGSFFMGEGFTHWDDVWLFRFF
jgi:hypothetical protein